MAEQKEQQAGTARPAGVARPRPSRLVVGLSGALVVAVGFAVAAGVWAGRADRQARVAQAREWAADALTAIGVDPERALLLALQAVTSTYAPGQDSVVPEAEAALHLAVQSAYVRQTLRAHTNQVVDLAYSPEGARLASASRDGTAIVWDLASGQPLVTITGPKRGIFGVAFSPDGKRLATADWDNVAVVWDAATGAELVRMVGHIGAVYAVAFSPDGTRLATAAGDGKAKVWDAATGALQLTLRGHFGVVTNVAFSPECASPPGATAEVCGTRLATSGQDGTARVWDATTGENLLTFTGHDGPVTDIAYSPDGLLLATSGSDGTVQVWDAATGEVQFALHGHLDTVTSVAFSPECASPPGATAEVCGLSLATTGYDRTVRLWDVATGRERLRLLGHTDAALAVAFDPLGGGQQLASGSVDGTVKLWDAGGGEALLTLVGPADKVAGVAFSPDGAWLATASYDSSATIWNVAGPGGSTPVGGALLTLPAHTTGPLVFDPRAGSPRLATMNWDRSVSVWDAVTGAELLHLNALTSGGLAFSPECASPPGATAEVCGARLATTSYWDQTATIWDATTGAVLLKLTGHFDTIYAIAFSPDGKRLATASADGTAKLWDAATGADLLTLEGHTDSVFAVAFSPDGRQLATAGNDQTARLWDAATGRERLTLSGHTAAILAVAFSPDGTRLATGSLDQTASVWDVATGTRLYALTDQTGGVLALAFSPDGTRLATGNDNNTARLYPASIETLMTVARSRLTRTWQPAECQQYLHTATCPPTP